MPKMIGNGYQLEKFLQGLLIANSKEIMTHWADKYIPAPKMRIGSKLLNPGYSIITHTGKVYRQKITTST